MGFTSSLCYCADFAQLRSTKLSMLFRHLMGWYIHVWRLLPLTEFGQAQHSHRVQVLHSPILEELLHDTRAVCVSQTLQRVTRKGIRELSLLDSPPIFRRAAIMLGIDPHSSCYCIMEVVQVTSPVIFMPTLPGTLSSQTLHGPLV